MFKSLQLVASPIPLADSQVRVGNCIFFSYFSTKTYVVDTQKHRGSYMRAPVLLNLLN